MPTKELLWITFDEFERDYRPVQNPRADYPEIAFDTHDPADVEAVNNADPRKVWSRVDGDGCDVIVSGWHYVNRLEYYVTENPAPLDTTVEVLIAREDVECECYLEDGYRHRGGLWGDGDPNCSECEGNGYRRVYYTREMIDEEMKARDN